MKGSRKPRKNAPGAGRPPAGPKRTASLPKIQQAHADKLREMAAAQGTSIAAVVEGLVDGGPATPPQDDLLPALGKHAAKAKAYLLAYGHIPLGGGFADLAPQVRALILADPQHFISHVLKTVRKEG